MRRRKRAGASRTPWSRRRRRALLILCAASLCLIPALVWRIGLRAELNQRLADLRAAGLPVTLEEHADWHTKAQGTDASFHALEKIFDSYQELDIATFDHLPKFTAREERLLTVPYPPSTRSALEARVAGNEAMLRHLIDAAALPRIQLMATLDWRQPSFGSDLERPMEVLCAYACLQAERGDGAGALDSLEAGIRVARACRAAINIEMLNRVIGYEYKLASVLPSIAVRTSLPGEPLRALEALIREDTWERDLAYAANGDRCLQLVWNSHVYGGVDTLYAFVGVHDRRKLRLLNYFDLFSQRARQPQWEWYETLRAKGFAHDYAFARPPLSHKYTPFPVAILRYFHDAGAFPATLSALAPSYLPAETVEALSVGVVYTHEGDSFTFGGDAWQVFNEEQTAHAQKA